MIPPRQRWWSQGKVLILPVLMWALVVASLWQPVQDWLSSGEVQDQTILHEWIDEARGNLPAMIEDYVVLLDRVRKYRPKNESPLHNEMIHLRDKLTKSRDKILEFLDTLGTPPTKVYSGTLPVFPTIYQIEVVFEKTKADKDLFLNRESDPIVWDSLLPTSSGDYEELTHPVGKSAEVRVRYQLHAYDIRQSMEAQRGARVRQLSLLAILTTGVAFAWVIYIQRREQAQNRQQLQAQQQVDQAERLLLEEELRRQEAERRQQEAEHGLLQQRLAAQEYEQKMLEMKSQLYASIGIMAGSYAHNIKNLLVRPNDLLRRCLETDGVSPDQSRMLHEVRHTLSTVTERLQQILQTVRRDPTRSEMGRIDLREVLQGIERTWRDLAWDRWKVQLSGELPDGPLWIDGDLSHLQQAIENLLFNARDATFEMRLHLREEARQANLSESARRQALIAAAAWKGQVGINARKQGDEVVVEVSDNGIGMTEEVRQRCTETHFSTKRDNASYEGHSTGMGLGLSFVQMVLDNHRAKLEIESAPSQGTTFRLRFPAITEAASSSR
jgi:signal transduction histidine kinase